MSAPRDLTEREQQILQAVVHMYVTEAEPVGSRSIVKRFELDLSPATVRNVMADLEELGYLEQVHTSSGRIPTERGYRYYVNHLMTVQQITLNDRERIEHEFSTRLNDADEVLKHTTQLLALISQQAGIAEAPSEAIATVQRLDLMPLSPDRMVLLTADNFGRVKTFTVALEEAVSSEMVVTLNNFLNAQLRGVRVDNLAGEVEARLRSYFDEQRRVAELALRVLNLMPAHRGELLFLEGTSQLFQHPEFQDVGRVREVFNLFDERDRLVTVLRESVAEREPGGGSVVIGGEGTDLKGLSVVTAPYEVHGRPAGMIGVIGPRRMPYARLTALVDYTAGMVSRVLGRLARE